MSSRKLTEKHKASLRKIYPELRALPEAWQFFIDGNDEVVYYLNSDKRKVKTRDHPRLGKIPGHWVFKVVEEDKDIGFIKLRYFNKKTKEICIKDPRHDVKTLEDIQKSARKTEGLEISASLRRAHTSQPLEFMGRQPIGDKNFRSKYEIMHTIDKGDGDLGAMNGGVFVVRIKGHTRLSVEKRFKTEGLDMAYKETEMLHRLKHGSLSFYTAGFIDMEQSIGSVYVEFCDRGSMDDVFGKYNQRNILARENDEDLERVPESFLWHILIGLVDAMAYLANGRTYVDPSVTDTKPAAGWLPVVHRDIKPDNVLFRSRDSLGSQKYPYCVVSDFGLATDDVLDPKHPRAEKSHVQGWKCGTCTYYAPELCYQPYPEPGNKKQEKKFPDGQRHTNKSDVWAVGACVYNLAVAEAPRMNGQRWGGSHSFAHLKFPAPKGLDNTAWIHGKASRIRKLDIGEDAGYSPQLRRAIIMATGWDPDKRPKSAELVQRYKRMIKEACHDKMTPEQLPGWAFRVHDYHSEKPRPAE